MIAHHLKKCFAIAVKTFICLITVLLQSGQKPGYRLHKSVIVHYRIPFIAFEPLTGISVMLRNNYSLGVCLLDCFSEIFPKLMVELTGSAKIGSHVQTPAVRIKRRRNPFFTNIHNIPVEFRGFLIIELRQSRMSPPSVITVVERPVAVIVKLEKIPVRTFVRYICSRRVAALMLVNQFRIQPLVKRTAMVKDSVDDNTDPFLVSRLNKSRKQQITGLQVFFIRRSGRILACVVIIHGIRLHK